MASHAGEPALTVTSTAEAIEVSYRPSLAVNSVRFEIHSGRNDPVPAFSDPSPHRPPQAPPLIPPSQQCWYPVVDFTADQTMTAVTRFAPGGRNALVSFNGWLSPVTVPVAEVLRFESPRLLQWENTIWTDDSEVRLTSFHLETTRPASGGRPVRLGLRPLGGAWTGKIVAIAQGEGGQVVDQQICEVVVEAPAMPGPPAGGGSPLSAARLQAALAATLGHTLRSINRDPNDPTRGGLYVFYDLDAGTYRSPHWIWGWPPSIKLLLEAATRTPVAGGLEADVLRAAACSIGEASLRFLPHEPEHPARDIPVSRWDRGPGYANGHKQAITPADAGFLAGMGWVPLYEATGDARWLEAATALTRALHGLMLAYAVPPQNYWTADGEWSDETIDESGFGIEVFAELFRLTGEPRHRELGRLYIEQHLAAFERDDGLWDRLYRRSSGARVPTIRMTRGLGWPMMGLLAAHRLLPMGRYLGKAERMAGHLLASQRPDGSWAHRFDRPVEEYGVGAKGTALWCWLLYRLHAATGNPAHLAAARRALTWLVENQDWSADRQARGGVVAVSWHSAVGYRPFYRVTCSYGAAYFGLAIMEELDLQSATSREASEPGR